YSAAVEAAISISIDGKDETGLLKIPTTKSPHQWNRINNISRITLQKGSHILTLNTKEKGLMNYMWLSFAKQN
ncbi:MAG: hypothetical protein LBJ58_05235, partial [Tannerellaceae bacterium]|nr:hypothetical protein [Tannerellaceae bacterium]